MEIINFISIIAVPFIIFIIVLYGFVEKKKVFDIFVEGAKDGINITIKILPTLIALFFAISALNNSGIIEFFKQMIAPVLVILKVPLEIIPLVLIRPISRECFNGNSSGYYETIWGR